MTNAVVIEKIPAVIEPAAGADVDALPLDEAGRTLASVQRILRLNTHPNAHSLQMATVMGWQCVVALDEFKEGELVVYLEVDAVVPSHAPWAAKALERYHWRVKTIRLRGELSQGLCVPLRVLNDPKVVGVEPPTENGAPPTLLFEPHEEQWDLGALEEGKDVTARLGVTKHIYGGSGGGSQSFPGATVGGNFPSGLGFHKTDEPRIQSNTYMLGQLRDRAWYAAVKYDGMSMTAFVDAGTGRLVVCSRNMTVVRPTPVLRRPAGEAVLDRTCGGTGAKKGSKGKGRRVPAAPGANPEAASATAPEVPPVSPTPEASLEPYTEEEVEEGDAGDDVRLVSERYIDRLDPYWRAVYAYRLQHALRVLGRRRYAIQAEVYGGGIQRNLLAVPADAVRIAVFSVFDLVERRYLKLAEMRKTLETLGLPMVEVVAEGEKFDLGVPELLELAKGVYPGTKNAREGIVIRSAVNDGLPAVSFKAINNDYMLKEP
ncbi:hypothetical protein HK101_008092 [Irineochytrium annulatum]|nr:hypothetical protein HK101_008092 [Irineochytrium annulatum]